MKRSGGGFSSLCLIVTGFALTWVCVNVLLWSIYKPVNTDGADWAPADKPGLLHDMNLVLTEEEREGDDKQVLCKHVDVVYTWVNGSDPNQIKLLAQYTKKSSSDGNRRFRDYGILRFSIRSIETFMPYVRNIILVTNGQIPTWLDTSSPKFRLVTHAQIFPNATDLPTFNSNAIEAHLHKIPGLAECFLYMNDDFFLGRSTPLDHFVDTKTGSLKLYMDGFKAPEVEKMKTNLWHRSVGFSNELISHYYYPNSTDIVTHNYAGHHCYFIKKHIADTIYERWQSEFDRTSHNKFRQGQDTAFPFLHANVAIEEFGAKKEKSTNIGGSWTAEHSNNEDLWKKITSKSPYCICLQDGLDDDEKSAKEIDYLEGLLCSLLPEKSSLEKKGDNPCAKRRKH